MLCKLVKHVINDATITLDRNNLLSTMALIQNVKKKFSLARLAYKNNISTNEKNTSFKNINLALFKFWHVLKNNHMQFMQELKFIRLIFCFLMTFAEERK